MSNYNIKAKNKTTGEIVEFYKCKDVFSGDVLDKTNAILYSERGFNDLYEVITDTPEHAKKNKCYIESTADKMAKQAVNNVVAPEAQEKIPYSCPLQVGTFGCACTNCVKQVQKSILKHFPEYATDTQEEDTLLKAGFTVATEDELMQGTSVPITQEDKGWRERFDDEFDPKTYDSYQGWKLQDLEDVKKFCIQVEQESYTRGQAEAYKKCLEVIEKERQTWSKGTSGEFGVRSVSRAIERLASKIGNTDK